MLQAMTLSLTVVGLFIVLLVITTLIILGLWNIGLISILGLSLPAIDVLQAFVITLVLMFIRVILK